MGLGIIVFIYSRELSKVSHNFVVTPLSNIWTWFRNLVKVYAAWILVLKLGLPIIEFSKGFTALLRFTSILFKDGFSKMFDKATQAFQDIFGLFASKLSRTLYNIESRVNFERNPNWSLESWALDLLKDSRIS